MKTESSDAFFRRFLTKNGLSLDTDYLDAFCFDLTREAATYLLDLVISGKKRATASSLTGYQIEGEKTPEVGDYSVITDFDGVPRCVMRTTAVTILPYKDITFDICRREGEDDCLESWQRSHERFFTDEGRELGYEFTPDMPVIFEDFEVVYIE